MRNLRKRYPAKGDFWIFRGVDHSIYRVDAVYPPTPDDTGPTVQITMIEGREPGFTTAYKVETMVESDSWILQNGPAQEILFDCPVCLKGSPIEDGDYMCIYCRNLTGE